VECQCAWRAVYGSTGTDRAAAITWVRDACSSMIGPAQTSNAIQGCDEAARRQWKRDLEARRQFTPDRCEHKRREREAHAG
jgi:hypothetical protein